VGLGKKRKVMFLISIHGTANIPTRQTDGDMIALTIRLGISKCDSKWESRGLYCFLEKASWITSFRFLLTLVPMLGVYFS
jgi:hypothetical protein